MLRGKIARLTAPGCARRRPSHFGEYFCAARNVDTRVRIGEAVRGTTGQRFDVAIPQQLSAMQFTQVEHETLVRTRQLLLKQNERSNTSASSNGFYL
jgi:hypothetical protein